MKKRKFTILIESETDINPGDRLYCRYASNGSATRLGVFSNAPGIGLTLFPEGHLRIVEPSIISPDGTKFVRVEVRVTTQYVDGISFIYFH